MPNTTTLNESARAPLDGTEFIRLATSGNNWKAQVNQPNSGGVSWPFGTVSGGTSASSSLVLESTTGTGTSDTILFKTGSQVECLRIDTNKRLTTGGTANISVAGSLVGTELNNAIGDWDFGTIQWHNQHGIGGWFTALSRSNVVGTHTSVINGDTLWSIDAYGSDGTTFQDAGSILIDVDATPGSGVMPGRIRFFTSPSGTASPTERLRIDRNGIATFVGSATAANYTNVPTIQGGLPAVVAAADGGSTWGYAVFATGANNGTLTLVNAKTRGSTANTHVALQLADLIGEWDFYGSDGTTYQLGAAIVGKADAAYTTGNTPSRLQFFTNAGTGITTDHERLRIDSIGRVIVNFQGDTLSLAANQAYFSVVSTDGTNNPSQISSEQYSADVAGGLIRLTKSRSATTFAQTIVNSGDFVGQILFLSSDGTNFRTSGAINCLVDGTPSAGVRPPGRFIFSTTNTSGTVVERLRIDASGNAQFSGSVGYSSVGVSGVGGAVTQATSRTTGVTLNNICGAITLVSAAGSATAATFTVTNSTVAATDVIILNQKSGTNLYTLHVTAVAAGSFNITFFTTGGTATDSPVINFAVIKAVAS